MTPTRVGEFNCMTDDPQLNVTHLIVKNMPPQHGLAICGYLMDAGEMSMYHADRGGPDGEGVCYCAPGDDWPKCPACITAKTASDARRLARV